jgi:hypothetical protein
MALLKLRYGVRQQLGIRPYRQKGALIYEEIAELQVKPVGTVETQMYSAVRKPRGMLQERGPKFRSAAGRSWRAART